MATAGARGEASAASGRASTSRPFLRAARRARVAEARAACQGRLTAALGRVLELELANAKLEVLAAGIGEATGDERRDLAAGLRARARCVLPSLRAFEAESAGGGGHGVSRHP